ncbi:hypothetical protein BBJ28_00021544 [Nothophytophthora sp. Chile5]|nr:hypothetical protein BBJ28_00021544 [Nothophytophthora sp. Chile5]
MEARGSLRDAMRRNAQPAGLARAYRVARQSGQLNLSSRELRAFPPDVFRFYDMVEEVGDMLQLGKLYKLRELGLEGNSLTQLPEALASLSHLEVLRLESNQLQALPSQIGTTTLCVFVCILPESNLLSLLLSAWSVGNLSSLKTLSAHSNQITELPASFGALTSLLTLDLKKNCIRSTGEAFVQMASIKYIDLRQNKLEVFPLLPEKSTCLDQLFLGFNSLHQIPEDTILAVKDSLTVFDVRDNKVQRLPERFAQLYRLKTLDLTNNDLHDLPAELGYLKYLNHLLVEGNPLRSIRRSIIASGTEPLKKYLRTRGGPPEGVDAMEEEVDEFAVRRKQIQQEKPLGADDSSSSQSEYLFREASASGNLQLVDMKLQQLPNHLQHAERYRFGETLLQLNLSKNPLLGLPAAIGELSSLQTLVAEQCGLKTIHPSVAMIPHLQHLRLRKNSLTAGAINAVLALGSRASLCFSLKELDLRNNLIMDMPAKLQFLESMDTLLLSFNRIRVLDGFPWSSMRQLSVLSLSDNRVSIPPTTGTGLDGGLIGLWYVYRFASELALCEDLRALYLIGNPQRGIRAHILNNGTDAVLKYLRNKLPPDVLPPTVNQEAQQSFMETEDSENVPPSNQKVDAVRHRDALKPLDSKRLRVDAATSPFRPTQRSTASQPSHARTPARQQAAHFESVASPFPNPPTQAAAAPPPAAEDEVLLELNVKISQLEQQLDDFAITAAKRFALKKDLAMTRSLKIRHLRKIEQKP